MFFSRSERSSAEVSEFSLSSCSALKSMSNLSQLPTAFECPSPSIAPGGTVALTLRPGLRENEPFELTVELLDEDEQQGAN